MADGVEGRLGRNEEAIRNLRDDVRERVDEERRTRERLHKLEGLVATLVDVQKQAKANVDQRQHRIELRLQILTVVIGLAAVLSPIVAIFIAGK